MKTEHIEKWMKEFVRGIPEIECRIEIRKPRCMKYHAYIVSFYESSNDEGNEIATKQMECIGESVEEAIARLEEVCMNDFARLHEITERFVNISKEK